MLAGWITAFLRNGYHLSLSRPTHLHIQNSHLHIGSPVGRALDPFTLAAPLGACKSLSGNADICPDPSRQAEGSALEGRVPLGDHKCCHTAGAMSDEYSFMAALEQRDELAQDRLCLGISSSDGPPSLIECLPWRTRQGMWWLWLEDEITLLP